MFSQVVPHAVAYNTEYVEREHHHSQRDKGTTFPPNYRNISSSKKGHQMITLVKKPKDHTSHMVSKPSNKRRLFRIVRSSYWENHFSIMKCHSFTFSILTSNVSDINTALSSFFGLMVAQYYCFLSFYFHLACWEIQFFYPCFLYSFIPFLFLFY